jgi:polysaccharide pyruvyl transferase WcaK-like protein
MRKLPQRRAKIKVLVTNLSYLDHNYGAQGIALPFIDQLNKYFDAEFTFVLSGEYLAEQPEKEFLEQQRLGAIARPATVVILAKCNFLFSIAYRFLSLIKKFRVGKILREKEYAEFLKVFKDHDVIVDLSGIEFIGGVPWKQKYSEYVTNISMQCLASKQGKLYLKYTKSYGPVDDRIFQFLVKRSLAKLPFLLIRGEHNLTEMQKLKIGVPLYSSPDISLVLDPESRKWALDYVRSLGMDPQKKIVGLSPSAVIANMGKEAGASCGDSHLQLCQKIIKLYKKKDQQILLLPHSIQDGKDRKTCDLALARELYKALPDKQNIFLPEEMHLTYRQTRAIIGLMDFYITGRYHSVASALFMAVPIISLSWHIKYRDIMSLFLDDFPIVDCRSTSVSSAISLIEEYYQQRDWFEPVKVAQRRKTVSQEIDKSIKLIVEQIDKFLDKGH